MKTAIKTSTPNKLQSVGLFLNKNAGIIVVCLMVCVLLCGTVFATDTLWTTLSGVLEKWIKRLGGVVMLVGGIMFGTGWMSDDPSRRTTGLNVMVSGGIIIAVAALTSTFFA